MSTEHPPEQVMVVPKGLAEAICNYKTYGPTAPITEQILLDNHSFRDRDEAEKNYDFKQVIPYIVVYHAEPGVLNSQQYLLSQRTNKQQENRLHGLYSIGQGGHVNELDVKNEHPITACLLREVREEFHIGEIKLCQPCGLINDDSNDVGKVHLGLVYRVKVGSLDLEVAEKGKHIARWASMEDLNSVYQAMENWSKIVMDHVLRP